MFRATYTSETLPLLLRYVASLGQTGLMRCHSSGAGVTVIGISGQQVVSCTTVPQHLEGLAAVQALTRHAGGTCHFEESWAAEEEPAPLSAASLIGLSMDDLLGRVLVAPDQMHPAHLDLTHIGPHSVPFPLVAAPARTTGGAEADLFDLDLLDLDALEIESDRAATESHRLLWALIDGQRSAQALASALGQPLDEVRWTLAQLEQQGSLRLGTGPVLPAAGVTEFVWSLTAVVGPVAQLLMRDALKAVGATKEAIPVEVLPGLKADVLRGCPVSRHPQIEVLFAALASLPPVQPAAPPFSPQDLTHQLTHLLGPIARELVNESLQQVQGGAATRPLDKAQILSFLNALQALLPPARRVEAVSLLQSFRR
ncbi:hypothetical protein E7T06_04780 [Deinococcus sp. Arct2-2]|uniref:hypothetical protein n=1 Tax=Deinococcus sp. Arct2-2 TaxID=2568653 RepID=UPI0010A51081|nr:hypothetical protein [Deinococcus sp. Arct2-2]THF71119.1 hypothetical protein E7T06_04780 [Deinococcus sp. Arct2-2]